MPLTLVMATKTLENDADFNKTIKANKFVLAVFMEDDTELEVYNQFLSS